MADTSDQADGPIGQSPSESEQLSQVVHQARRLALLVDAASIEIRPSVFIEKKPFIRNCLRLLQGALAALGPQPKRIAQAMIWIADIANKVALWVWVTEEPLQETKGLEYAKRLSALAKALEHEIRPLPDASPPQERDRLRFDEETFTVFLDNEGFQISNPHAFRMYRAIAEAGEPSITLAALRKQKAVTRKGAKVIPYLKKGLPEALRATMKSGPGGHWIVLPNRPNSAK